MPASVATMVTRLAPIDPSASGSGHADREQRHQGHQRDHRHVLEQEDGERGPAVAGTHLVPLGQQLEDEGGRRHCQPEAQHGSGRPWLADGQAYGGQRKPGDDDLQRAQAEQGAPHRPQPLRLEFETDDEHQEDDAELGGRGDRANADHRPRRVRAEDDADREQPEHRAETGALEQHDRRHAGAEQEHRGGQQLVEVHLLDQARFAARLPGSPS